MRRQHRLQKPAEPGAPAENAGFWLRVGAKLIDHGLFSPVETACIGFGAYLNALGFAPWVIASGWVFSAVLWYGYILAMTWRRGQTVGKIAAGIRVATAAGEPASARVVARRTLLEGLFDLAGVPAMLLGWWVARTTGGNVATAALIGAAVGALISALNPLYILVSPQRQALHDLGAGTRVFRVSDRRCRGFLALCIAGALLPEATVFGIIRPFLVEAYVVPSGSMEPTIEIGDRILANKLVPRLRGPRRHEIVMFRAPAWADAEGRIFVKRVVGVAGDRLQVRGNKLIRNGVPVEEPYLMEPPRYQWPERGGEVVVPAGRVVVLGDNRNNSNDSHLWRRLSADGRTLVPEPFLPVEAVRGKLVYRYWPPDRMGTVAQEEWDLSAGR